MQGIQCPKSATLSEVSCQADDEGIDVACGVLVPVRFKCASHSSVLNWQKTAFSCFASKSRADFGIADKAGGHSFSSGDYPFSLVRTRFFYQKLNNDAGI